MPATSRRRFTPLHYSLPALLAAGVLVAAAVPVATSLAPAASTSVSLWPTSTVPKVAAAADKASVELGVKFHADVNGTVSAVRYYKSASNTGTHTGSVWSASGTRLATATFTGGTSNGWQTVTSAKPVAITANTTYVASYLAPAGHYAEDTGYFTGKTRDNGVLHAPANAGVYHYGASGGFPTGTYQGANYYVDVVFNPGTSSTPATPPPSSTP